MKKRIDRLSHAGKDRYEKEAYQNFIASRFTLDKTEKDPVDVDKTSESSFDDDREKQGRIKKKSRLLKIKDFFYDNWFIAIVSAVLLILLSLYITLNREQGSQAVRIEKNNEDVKTLESKITTNNDAFEKLNEKYIIFSTTAAKDIEYIKKKLKL